MLIVSSVMQKLGEEVNPAKYYVEVMARDQDENEPEVGYLAESQIDNKYYISRDSEAKSYFSLGEAGFLSQQLPHRFEVTNIKILKV